MPSAQIHVRIDFASDVPAKLRGSDRPDFRHFDFLRVKAPPCLPIP